MGNEVVLCILAGEEEMISEAELALALETRTFVKRGRTGLLLKP